MTAGSGTLHFTEDPDAFLTRAGDHLAADALLGTILASATHQAQAADAAGIRRDPTVPRWWVSVEGARGAVVGAAMRSAPFRPYPLYLLPMPDAAAVELARALHGRGEAVDGVNGVVPAARVCAEELAGLTGRAVRLDVAVRLFELAELVPPRAVEGRLRPARAGEVDLVLDWFARFGVEADEQAGRAPGVLPAEEPSRPEMLRRIVGGQVQLWVDPSDTPRHLTVFRPPSFGVSRIGPVFTPRRFRGLGYASAAVAQVSRWLLDDGARVCLNTDQANPTSNAIYERLGFAPVADMANFSLV